LWSLKFVIIKANNTVKGNVKQELPVHVFMQKESSLTIISTGHRRLPA